MKGAVHLAIMDIYNYFCITVVHQSPPIVN
jgi:hypothetical protein